MGVMGVLDGVVGVRAGVGGALGRSISGGI